MYGHPFMDVTEHGNEDYGLSIKGKEPFGSHENWKAARERGL